jgi:hypothetical protein
LLNKDNVLKTKRKNNEGYTEEVITTFDHALIALKLYELTENQTYLERYKEYFSKTKIKFGEFTRWNFSLLVTDIPPDADSTALSLLFFSIAQKNGINIPKEFNVKNNIKQFDNSVVKTFFNVREKNEFDPVVNTTLAFLYVISTKSKIVPQKLAEYLRKTTSELDTHSSVSLYYPKATYFAERMAKLSFYCPYLLDDKCNAKLDNYLINSSPKNTLDASLISIGASYRGLTARAKELNDLIRCRRKSNGKWTFGTLYRQRTPKYSYGCEIITSLFAIEALALENEKPTKIVLN